MTTIASILAESEADLPWPIDHTDRDPRSEEARQIAVLRMGRLLCPAVMWVAIPNGARRTQWESAKAKREGMNTGASDLIALWHGGEAWIEMKNGVKMPSLAQREFLNALFRMGHNCGVFRREDSVMRFLMAAGAPFVGRIM